MSDSDKKNECKCAPTDRILGPNGEPQCCCHLTPDELRKFTKVMTSAWDDTDYRKTLLTFAEGSATDWIWYPDKDRTDAINRTRQSILDKLPKPVDAKLKKKLDEGEPVVLSDLQFDRNIYRMKSANELVMRLPPKAPSPAIFIQGNFEIEFLQNLLTSHICGM